MQDNVINTNTKKLMMQVKQTAYTQGLYVNKEHNEKESIAYKIPERLL